MGFLKGTTEDDKTRGIVWNEIFIQDPATASASSYPSVWAQILLDILVLEVLLLATLQ